MQDGPNPGDVCTYDVYVNATFAC